MPVSKYTINRKLQNGWNIRLEFIPFDYALDGYTIANNTVPVGTTEELDSVCLLELGDQVAEFDSVPYGLCKPHTLKLKLAWSRLPADMQGYLEAGYVSNKVRTGTFNNLWLLFSDRGTNEASYTLEFAGTEDDVETVELEPLSNNEYAYSIDLVDIVYHGLKTTTGERVFFNDGGSFQGFREGRYKIHNLKAWHWYFKTLNGHNQAQEAIQGLRVDNTKRNMEIISDVMGYMMLAKYCHHEQILETDRQARTPSTLVNKNIFDSNGSLTDIFTVALELYPCTTDGNNVGGKIRRLQTSAIVDGNNNTVAEYPLKSDQIYQVTDVNFSSGDWAQSYTRIGGIYAYQDKYGWGRRDVTMYDLLRDLCETLGVKASYKVTYIPPGAAVPGQYRAGRLEVTWFVKRIAGSRDSGNTSDSADDFVDMTAAIQDPKVVLRSDNILKSEVRYETEQQEDATEIVRISKGARSSRSMNTELIVHNVPVYLPDFEKNKGRSGPMKQTNLLYFFGAGSNGYADGSIMKVHEDTKYWYGPGVNQYVSVSSPASDNPLRQTPQNQDATMIQLVAMQTQSSMGAALGKLHLKVFSDKDNAIVETEFPLGYSQYMMPEYLAGRHILQYGIADIFSNINWSYALPTSLTVNWQDGTIKVKYYMLKPTSAN